MSTSFLKFGRKNHHESPIADEYHEEDLDRFKSPIDSEFYDIFVAKNSCCYSNNGEHSTNSSYTYRDGDVLNISVTDTETDAESESLNNDIIPNIDVTKISAIINELEKQHKETELLRYLQPGAVPPPKYSDVNPNTLIRFPIFENVAPVDKNDHLPSYHPSIDGLTVVSMKQEFLSPYDQIREPIWKNYIMELNSTQLNFYELDQGLTSKISGYYNPSIDPVSSLNKKNDSSTHSAGSTETSPTTTTASSTTTFSSRFSFFSLPSSSTKDTYHFNKIDQEKLTDKIVRHKPRYLTYEKLYKSYSLQFGKLGLATDYPYLFNALRLRLEGEQFLLNFSHIDDLIVWIMHIQVGIGISLDLELRELPDYRVVPRHSRYESRTFSNGERRRSSTSTAAESMSRTSSTSSTMSSSGQSTNTSMSTSTSASTNFGFNANSLAVDPSNCLNANSASYQNFLSRSRTNTMTSTSTASTAPYSYSTQGRRDSLQSYSANLPEYNYPNTNNGIKSVSSNGKPKFFRNVFKNSNENETNYPGDENSSPYARKNNRNVLLNEDNHQFYHNLAPITSFPQAAYLRGGYSSSHDSCRTVSFSSSANDSPSPLDSHYETNFLHQTHSMNSENMSNNIFRQDSSISNYSDIKAINDTFKAGLNDSFDKKAMRHLLNESRKCRKERKIDFALPELRVTDSNDPLYEEPEFNRLEITPTQEEDEPETSVAPENETWKPEPPSFTPNTSSSLHTVSSEHLAQFCSRTSSIASTLPFTFSSNDEDVGHKWHPAVKLIPKKKFVRDTLRCLKPLTSETRWIGKAVCRPCEPPEFETNNKLIKYGKGIKKSLVDKFEAIGSDHNSNKNDEVKYKNHFLKAYIVRNQELKSNIEKLYTK